MKKHVRPFILSYVPVQSIYPPVGSRIIEVTLDVSGTPVLHVLVNSGSVNIVQTEIIMVKSFDHYEISDVNHLYLGLVTSSRGTHYFFQVINNVDHGKTNNSAE